MISSPADLSSTALDAALANQHSHPLLQQSPNYAVNLYSQQQALAFAYQRSKSSCKQSPAPPTVNYSLAKKLDRAFANIGQKDGIAVE